MITTKGDKNFFKKKYIKVKLQGEKLTEILVNGWQLNQSSYMYQ